VAWAAIAILSAAVAAVVSIVDSHLITRRMPSFMAFLTLIGAVNAIYGLIILGASPFPAGIDTEHLLVAFGSSLARVAAILLMLRTMRSEEVSRIIPVVSTLPIFVAILAVPLLGEILEWVEWLAILITVAGAVLISARWDYERKGIRLRRSFAALILSSVLFALSNVGTKHALEQFTFWNMHGIIAISLGLICLMISLRPSTLKEIRQIDRRNTVMGLISLNESIAVAAFALSFRAIELGPVSLVSTILSTRPAFVFIFAVALSWYFPTVLKERLSPGTITIKALSIALTIGGVALLTLYE
jgi:drug/metabolite transporter (DMT)-like permease